MEDAIASIARYLVVKRLVNDVIALLSIKEYLIDGASPSTIAFKYRTSKFRIRGYVQRVIDKAGNYRAAARIIEVLYPYVMSLEPIILRSGGRAFCTLCNEYVRVTDCEQHIRKKHKDLFNEIVRNTAARVYSSFKA